MKYKKGTFVVVPNKDVLRGLPSEVQSVYFWICEHANDDGECFPSRKKLAQESGTGLRRIDKYISQLEELSLLKKTVRPKIGLKNSSNLYQVQILDDVANLLDPSSQMELTPSSQKEAVTISNINEPNITNLSKAQPFSFLEELVKLGNSKWKPDLIIHNYYQFTHMSFENEKQWKSNYSRNKRPAQQLEGYSAKQIHDTMRYCEENYKETGWTLETLVKVIGRVVNIKK